MPVIDTNLEANYTIAAARGGLDEVMQRWSAESAVLREQADARHHCNPRLKSHYSLLSAARKPMSFSSDQPIDQKLVRPVIAD